MSKLPKVKTVPPKIDVGSDTGSVRKSFWPFAFLKTNTVFLANLFVFRAFILFVKRDIENVKC